MQGQHTVLLECRAGRACKLAFEFERIARNYASERERADATGSCRCGVASAMAAEAIAVISGQLPGAAVAWLQGVAECSRVNALSGP